MLFRRIEIALVLVVALIGGILAVVLLPAEQRFPGIAVVLAGCVLLTFAVQLAVPQQKGFVDRLTASLVGAFGVLLVVSLVALPLA
ncbi:MAG: hypothetical protein ABWZ77_07390 [Naasia sp.]